MVGIPLFRSELEARDASAFDETEEVGMHDVIKRMKQDSHPEFALKKQDEFPDEEKQELRHFCPAFLESVDWGDDDVDAALRNLSLFCC